MTIDRARDHWDIPATAQRETASQVPASTDYLIVGGGSAGCVLASRLSENPGKRVVLVESGPDLREDEIPDSLRSSYPSKAFFSPQYFQQGLQARFGEFRPGSNAERPLGKYEQARVLGGGSSINGLMGNRGAPADYDEWEENGAIGWNWENVFPYFRKLETDLDFQNEFHGDEGPVFISRLRKEQVSGFARQAVATLKANRFQDVEDQNGEWGDGVMAPATTMDRDQCRSSVALGYLPSAVRRRENLHVMTGSTARRLLVEGGAVTGAEVDTAGDRISITARETIVCCGAIYTPALLMRSGLGPASSLRQAGLQVEKDIPGIGRNLQEHPALGISSFIRRGYRQLSQNHHHNHAHLRFSSGFDGCPNGDMAMAVLTRSAWHRVGEQLGTFYLWVNKSYSKGEVRLLSADPEAPPEIDFHLLSDQRDLERLRAAFKYLAGISLDSSMDHARLDVFPTIFSDRVRKASRPSAWNALQTAIFAGMLDYLGPARTRLIRRFIAPVDIRRLLGDDAALDDYIRTAVVGVWHAVGTCRMGSEDNPLAVTDSEGRVYGVGGLRVCDASLMPTIPCANTNLPTIMIAERIADLVKQSAGATANVSGSATKESHE